MTCLNQMDFENKKVLNVNLLLNQFALLFTPFFPIDLNKKQKFINTYQSDQSQNPLELANTNAVYFIFLKIYYLENIKKN